jgi:hypothetical protein
MDRTSVCQFPLLFPHFAASRWRATEWPKSLMLSSNRAEFVTHAVPLYLKISEQKV